MADARFYVHNLRLVDAAGRVAPVEFEPDGIWQSRRVALVDLEDGLGACTNGSREMHPTVTGRVAPIDAVAIAFSIGVPADLNHRDPMQASAPLGYTDMHWHWASGYKFLRAAVSNDEDSFFLHLGSNRCEGTIGDISGCMGSNRPEIYLDDFRPGQDRVVLHLDRLADGNDLTDDVASSCMSGPAEDSCAAPFVALGLDFATGESVATASAFTVGGPK